MVVHQGNERVERRVDYRHIAYPSPMQRIVTAGVMVLVTVAACADTGAKGPAAPDQVTGVIVEIDSQSIDEVTSFTLKDGDVTYDIYIAEDVDYGFPLGHLQEHVQASEPVTVDLEERDDDKLYALTIEDA